MIAPSAREDLAQNVPHGDINHRHSKLRDALYTLVLKRAPEIGTNLLRECRILTNEHRLDFVLEDRFDHPWTAFHHAEVAVTPTSNTSIREYAKDNATGRRPKIVDGITGKLGG